MQLALAGAAGPCLSVGSERVFQIAGGTDIAGVRNGDRFVLPVYDARVNDSLGTITAVTSNALIDGQPPLGYALTLKV